MLLPNLVFWTSHVLLTVSALPVPQSTPLPLYEDGSASSNALLGHGNINIGGASLSRSLSSRQLQERSPKDYGYLPVTVYARSTSINTDTITNEKRHDDTGSFSKRKAPKKGYGKREVESTGIAEFVQLKTKQDAERSDKRHNKLASRSLSSEGPINSVRRGGPLKGARYRRDLDSKLDNSNPIDDLPLDSISTVVVVEGGDPIQDHSNFDNKEAQTQHISTRDNMHRGHKGRRGGLLKRLISVFSESNGGHLEARGTLGKKGPLPTDKSVAKRSNDELLHEDELTELANSDFGAAAAAHVIEEGEDIEDDGTKNERESAAVLATAWKRGKPSGIGSCRKRGTPSGIGSCWKRADLGSLQTENAKLRARGLLERNVLSRSAHSTAGSEHKRAAKPGNGWRFPDVEAGKSGTYRRRILTPGSEGVKVVPTGGRESTNIDDPLSKRGGGAGLKGAAY